MLGTFLTLDQSIFNYENYSSESTQKVTGTLYSDINKTTAFNLTGYTLTLKLYKDSFTVDYFNQTCTITVAANGTWYINIASNTVPNRGLYLARLELSKSGSVISSLNRVEVLVQ